MPLPTPDWSRPSTCYDAQAFNPDHYTFAEHFGSTSDHVHNVGDYDNLSARSCLLGHLAAFPATRGGPGWVAHRHS